MSQGYALRYYKTYDLNGHYVRLEIHKKYKSLEYAPAAIQIGRVLQGLSLDVQGEQDDIISPIVKTSLSMTFADAPGVEAGKKTGDWEEFYTPDSTGYKVMLFLDGVKYWSGYVTPDSFEEDLEYRGSVTIVARDNIGHLQDFTFDASGNEDSMISVREIIDMAWSKVDCLLDLIYASGADVVWPECEGYTALDCLMNVEAFKDKNWFEVMQTTLDSFGLALRYVGNNKAMIMPLRALPCLDKESLSLVEVKDILLQTAGHRSLMTAAKAIKDVSKYDIEREYVTPNVTKKDFEGILAYQTYRCVIDGENYGRVEHDAPVHMIGNNNNGWSYVEPNKTLYFNPFYHEIGPFLARQEDEASVRGESIMYLAANNTQDRYAEYRQQILCKPFALKMQFGKPIGLDVRDRLDSYSETQLSLSKIVYQLFIENDDLGVMYWSGGRWTDTATDITVSYDTASNVTEFTTDMVDFDDLETESVLLTFRIKKIEYSAVGYLGTPETGVYARILKLAFEVPENIPVQDEFTLNSIYDENYNYLINRQCDIVASSQSFVVPKVIKNGIFLPIPGYRSAWSWQWPGNEITSLQALIAQQILMYYSQPNSIITGTLLAIAQNEEVLNFNCLWRWRNRKLALISGQLDFTTGYIESAKLREYIEWSNLWPTEGVLTTESDDHVITENEETIIIGK